VRCDDAARTLAELADGAEVAPSGRTAHIERCLRCQAELAQHRKLRRAMVGLREQLIDPGPELLEQVLLAVEEVAANPSRSVLHRNRAAYVAAATATAATAAGAVLLASRTRRTRLSPTG
jgi:anti-sigma factor RsiW